MQSRDVTALAHRWIAPALADGGLALDATAGTGGDTLFLARAAGASGRVHAFDIQPRAIERARARLRAAGLGSRVRWYCRCHGQAARDLAPGSLDAVMFNLGWLPGGDRAIVTRPATTRAALGACAALLRPGGRLSVVCYRGHRGGTEEEAAVAAWVAAGADGLCPAGAGPARTPAQAPVLHMLERGGAAVDTGMRGDFNRPPMQGSRA